MNFQYTKLPFRVLLTPLTYIHVGDRRIYRISQTRGLCAAWLTRPRDSALYAISVRRLALSPKAPTVGAVRLPPHNPSRDCTCLKLVVIIGGHFLRIRDGSRSDAGLPSGDFHPISSCPCRAYQINPADRLRRRLIEALGSQSIY